MLGSNVGDDALPKTNIALENKPSQIETSIPTIHFQVRTFSFRDGYFLKYTSVDLTRFS